MAVKEKQKGESVLKVPKRELFCWLYAGYHNRLLFGNATRCYMQAYGYNDRVAKIQEKLDAIDVEMEGADRETKKELQEEKKPLYKEITNLERTANTEGNLLLSNPVIYERVDFLIESYISHNLADRELLKVIVQDDDLMPKVAAIREYNRLKDRGAKGVLEGKFEFSWEGEGEKPTGKPTLKKAKVTAPKSDTGVSFEGEE